MKINRAILPLLTIALLTGACLPSTADQKIGTDWGNVPGLRSPHPDSKGRSGQWWWPELPKRSSNSTAITGNHGRVFGPVKVIWTCGLPAPQKQPVPPPNDPIICNFAFHFNNILFQFDSVKLSNEGKLEADKLIGEMRKFPNDSAVCVGHTDDVGPETYNQLLGLRRAQAVVDYMTHSGIAPTRVRAKSKGESEPAVPNNTPANRALNRRVVFEVTMGK